MIAQVMKVTRLTDEVEVLGATLTQGRTIRTLCPRCGGGTSKESSFVVTRSYQNRILYHCFRATCQWRGTLQDGEPVSSTVSVPYERRTRTFVTPVDELSWSQIQWFRDKFGLGPDRDTFYCEQRDMYAYKVRGPDLQHRGWQLRAYWKGAPLRADNYVERDEPFISWYFPKKKEIGGVVIVEDVPSARKVALCGIASVALMGTSMDYERAYEIGKHCEGFVVIALDRGTLTQALAYRERYEVIWGSTEVWVLDKDLKEVSRQRIRQALYDGATDFISNPDKQE